MEITKDNYDLKIPKNHISDFIVIKNKVEFNNVNFMNAPSAAAIKNAQDNTQISSELIQTAKDTGGILTVVSIMLSVGFVSTIFIGFFGRFVQSIDILTRLGYINVTYGPIMTTIFEYIDSNFNEIQFPKSVFYIDPIKYSKSYRGKLSAYKVSVSAFQEMPLYIILYLLMVLIQFLTLKCKSKKNSNKNKLLKFVQVIKTRTRS